VEVKDITHMYLKFVDMATYHGATLQDAEDSVQDLFIKLLGIQQKEGNIDRLEYKGSVNMVYIFNALRGIVYNKHRSNNRTADREIWVGELVDHQQTMHITEVQDRLKTMDGFSRKLYTAYMEDSISLRELSRRTNISVTTLYYGVRQIREQLKDIFYECT